MQQNNEKGVLSLVEWLIIRVKVQIKCWRKDEVLSTNEVIKHVLGISPYE
jgi:hypothetical protein